MADLLDKVFKTNVFKMLKELKSRNVKKVKKKPIKEMNTLFGKTLND